MPQDKREILARSLPSQKITGIYFLVESEEIVYIGQAVDIHVRIADHRKKRVIQFDRYSWIECSESELNNLEAMYILKFVPQYNKVVPAGDRFVTSLWLKARGLGRFKFNRYVAMRGATVYPFGSLRYYDLQELLSDTNFSSLLQSEGVAL